MSLTKAATKWVASAQSCIACPISGHQTPPAVFLGLPKAPTLVLGQNPAEIRQHDTERLARAAAMRTETDPIAYRNLYLEDFRGSKADVQLAHLFGPGWIDSGRFMYSSVVLCRTFGNVTVRQSVMDVCWEANVQPLVALWLRSGKSKKLAVLMGGIAAFWKDDIEKMGATVLHIPHYAVWNYRIIERVKREWAQVNASMTS